MFIRKLLTSATNSTLTHEHPLTIPEPPMVNTREIVAIGLLFVVVIVFQFYVYIKIDESAQDYEDLDAKRKEEERKRRNDMLMKALSAF